MNLSFSLFPFVGKLLVVKDSGWLGLTNGHALRNIVVQLLVLFLTSIAFLDNSCILLLTAYHYLFELVSLSSANFPSLTVSINAILAWSQSYPVNFIVWYWQTLVILTLHKCRFYSVVIKVQFSLRNSSFPHSQ